MPFPPCDIHKNPRSMYARVLHAKAQFVLKIELLPHIMGTTPILEMARAYGLRPRLWLLSRHSLERPYLFFYKRGGSIHILGLLRQFLWVRLRILVTNEMNLEV